MRNARTDRQDLAYMGARPNLLLLTPSILLWIFRLFDSVFLVARPIFVGHQRSELIVSAEIRLKMEQMANSLYMIHIRFLAL